MRTIGEIPRKTPVEPKKENAPEGAKELSQEEFPQPTDVFDESVVIN